MTNRRNFPATDWLPRREHTVVEMSINGQPCWCRYERKEMYGLLWESWVLEVQDFNIMSIIRKPGSFGYDQGLFEIAFMRDGAFSDLMKDEFGDKDVLGYLTEEEVLKWAQKAIRKLDMV